MRTDNYPKLLKTPAALRAAGYRLIIDDIDAIEKRVNCLFENNFFSDRDEESFWRQVFEEAILIKYRRIFATGGRVRLDEGIFEDTNHKNTHKWLMEIASQHIAHSISSFETRYLTAQVSIDDNGKCVRISGPGFAAHRTACFLDSQSAEKILDILLFLKILVEKTYIPPLEETVEDEISVLERSDFDNFSGEFIDFDEISDHEIRKHHLK
ncbi:MAG TPA: hypothetical protein VMY41_09775 [Thermohalobaculum sp.]|nr:hypothetical protein [Thermohalobaculum sp.]